MGTENEITLISAQPEDFDYFYDLRHRTMREHFLRAGKVWDDGELPRHRRSFNPNTLHIIHDRRKRVGCVDISPNGDAIRISLFCIEPDHQNLGIGSEVIRRIIRQADDSGQAVVLDVLKGNKSARLYERLGFERVQGEIEILDYYRRCCLASQEKPPKGGR